MAEQLTQMIRRRIELGKTVGAGIDTFLDDVVAGYDEYLAPASPGGGVRPGGPCSACTAGVAQTAQLRSKGQWGFEHRSWHP